MITIAWIFRSFLSCLAAACSAVFHRTIFVCLRTAAAFAPVSPQHAVDDSSGAADTGLDLESSRGTVFTAGAAFHAGIAGINPHLFSVHRKYMMRADIHAHTTAGAFLFIQFNCCDIFQINQVSHGSSYARNTDVIHAAIPRIPAVISSGRANRISFFTPDSDV